MKLKIGEKELSVKFGYKPTLKERIISKFLKYASIADKDGNTNLEKVEDLLLFLPEFLLVGLQVHHEDFRYNYDTGEKKEEQLDKAFALVEEYMDGEEADAMKLIDQLQEALLQDSFLRGLFQKEQRKQKEAESRAARAAEEAARAAEEAARAEN